ncbi:LNS2 domain-containing protein [Haliangium sp.]|uniref:LNS2 domain-containing protein n=1 Tax=Haliangium sp. TaxID=2663208 RepID=UPI003D0C89C9
MKSSPRLAAMALLLTPALGCMATPDDPGGDPPDPPSGPDAGPPPSPPDAQVPPTVGFRTCMDGVMPADLPQVDWSNPLNDVITLADPWHSAQDVIAATGHDTNLAGKFSYGDISKDLEGERIEVWIDDCAGGYRKLGEQVSNSDGRIGLPLSSAEVPAAGVYGLVFRVMGDDSTAASVLRVYPPGTHFVVFDIDATLTTSDSELVGQIVAEILTGIVAPPDARAGAHDIAALRHQQGYELIYLTGRPYLLDALTRGWLDDLSFPGGTVHLTDEVADSWPSESAVGDYKADFLQSVLDLGFTIDLAYGNASSDIYAYEQVGVAKERTYILGENGGMAGTVALGDTYLAHLDDAAAEAAPEQPFER